MEDEEHHDVAVGEELPHDLLLEILLRLPVKSLSRFRCVCRAWNTAITSRQFISLQQQSRSQRDGVDTSLLLLHYSLTRRRNLFAVYRDDESALFTEIQHIDFPIRSHDTYFFVASCNGLLCFTDYLINSLGIVLWNPSIRKYVKTPIPRPINTDINHAYVLGFGFDCRTNDYKIVRLVYTLARNSVRQIPPEIEIFELGRFVWRRKTGVVPYFIQETSQAFVNGGVHWIGYSRPPPDHHQRLSLQMVVVVFDVHDEHFTDLEIPSGIVNVYLPNLTVTVCMESLCLLEMNPWIEMEGRPMEGVCCVWVMKQYGVTSSWSRQFNIDMRGLGGLGRVLWFGKHGEVLVVNSRNELVSYDPETRGIKSVGLQGVLSSFQVMNHVESLVLLDR